MTDTNKAKGMALFDEAFQMLNAGTYKSSYETAILQRMTEARAYLTGDLLVCTSCGEEAPEIDHGWCLECIRYDQQIMNGSL